MFFSALSGCKIPLKGGIKINHSRKERGGGTQMFAYIREADRCLDTLQ